MKGNKLSDTLKEYARKLNDDDLRYVSVRLSQRVGADLAEAVEFFQKNSEVDHWLSSSKSAGDFYDMIDVADSILQNESKKRFALLEAKKRD